MTAGAPAAGGRGGDVAARGPPGRCGPLQAVTLSLFTGFPRQDRPSRSPGRGRPSGECHWSACVAHPHTREGQGSGVRSPRDSEGAGVAGKALQPRDACSVQETRWQEQRPWPPRTGQSDPAARGLRAVGAAVPAVLALMSTAASFRPWVLSAHRPAVRVGDRSGRQPGRTAVSWGVPPAVRVNETWPRAAGSVGTCLSWAWPPLSALTAPRHREAQASSRCSRGTCGPLRGARPRVCSDPLLPALSPEGGLAGPLEGWRPRSRLFASGQGCPSA